MNYKTHLVGGLLIGLTSIKVLNNMGVNLESVNQAVIISTSTIGALIPDIDHKGSFVGRRAKVTSTIASSLFKHRGATHSPILASIFMPLSYFLFSNFILSGSIIDVSFIGVYLGVISHIMLDWITKEGVPLLYPLSKRKFSLTNMKTGSIYEKVVMLLMVIVSFTLITIK